MQLHFPPFAAKQFTSQNAPADKSFPLSCLLTFSVLWNEDLFFFALFCVGAALPPTLCLCSWGGCNDANNQPPAQRRKLLSWRREATYLTNSVSTLSALACLRFISRCVKNQAIDGT